MTRKYFGTDGIRGRVGNSPITPDFVLRLGYAAGQVLTHTITGTRPTVLIGKDTRISGYMLESALEAGLSAAGADVLLVGPMPTPGIAHLTRAMRLAAGIVISASHNLFEDNGIKFFSGNGAKLPDQTEHAIEAALDFPLESRPSAQLGKVRRIEDAGGRYLEFCKSTFPNNLDLRGLKLVVDCAHGATYHIAPKVFHELGAEVIAIGVEPNGLNINDRCGATDTAAMRAAVIQHGAHFGIALDGDGDRLMMADHDGNLFDGDQLLYVMVKDRAARAALNGGVVGTLMTNFALEQQFAKMTVPFARAKVGDRYILEMLREKGWECGGENSGHILCLDKHTTGDGIISALQVLAAMCRHSTTLGEYAREVALYPQVLINVRTTQGFDFAADANVQTAIAEAERSLAGAGRVLLRASGTEPVIRVMVEGADHKLVKTLAGTIAETVQQRAAR